MPRSSTYELADEVVKRVRAIRPDTKILRYDSHSYDSVYLKFDFGVGGSLRIADHKSRKNHLAYTFNLLLDCDKPYIKEPKYPAKYRMHFYGPGHINKLVRDIVDRMLSREDMYGRARYCKFMEQQKETQYKILKGFWSKAREI